ncbi:MAG: 50S ribosomal protein L19 [Spirochaetia bacterium]|jgi:large subunit ribosomal protein L19|nr:50S ribosomal protein L19 [Spirochaetia bacterium]
MDVIKAIEAGQVKEVNEFHIGDTVRVHFSIIEGKTERIQVYEGLVIAKKNSGLRATFMVRKISYGVGVERIFPLNSPRIQKVEVVRHGRVRRAKLYYMRGRSGKAARVAELIRKKSAKAEAPAPQPQPEVPAASDD